MALAIGALAACGGGGGGTSTPPGPTYSFATPTVGEQRTYAVTDTDNSSNTINLTSQQTVTSVNSDGTFDVNIIDPTGTSVIVNGTDYSIIPGAWVEDSSGRDLSVLFSPVSAPSYTCTYNPNGLGPGFPISVGQTWQLSFIETCGGSGVSYTQTGTVEDVETIAVTAGSFKTVRLSSTVTWTTAAGGNVTETITRWVDSTTGRGVKESANFARTGVLPVSSYLVSQTVELQSVQ